MEIRIYGCELPAFNLPKFIPIRIFSLEYIREMINMDQLHFVATNKKARFKTKNHVGPFICNVRAVGNEVEKLLRQMNFKLSFTWSYEPLGVISKPWV